MLRLRDRRVDRDAFGGVGLGALCQHIGLAFDRCHNDGFAIDAVVHQWWLLLL